MAGAASIRLVRIATCSVVVAMLGVAFVRAERPDGRGNRDHRWPVYQRRAFDWHDKHGHDDRRGSSFKGQFFAPPVSSGWFQRPYPYHLDYYKMRYGGSYAPYFGNLYGPPQVVTAPPYYGPYYGEYGYGNPSAYGPGSQNPGYPGGVMYAAPVENETATPKDEQATPSIGEKIPAP